MVNPQKEDTLQSIERLQQVQKELAAAAERAHRNPADVTLVAISKKHPARAVQTLAAHGHLDFGENYVQEVLDKQDTLADPAIRWHFVGGLQSNKAKFVAGRFHLVHSVDSEKLARMLQKSMTKKREAAEVAPDAVQDVLLQVNLDCEAQKSGTSADQAEAVARAIGEMDALRLRGLMLMPRFDEDPEQTRPSFAALRRLRDELQDKLGVELPHLSMGMSNDFVQAVEEGATLVRVGTRIFGPREY
ncbi:MAG: YggS family pyridoxal phosphate-dependent enzyme [Desulfovibrio sp.]|uniref:YggS family pyridoxal phosphate-dependent enzyme n=1 Tax=Desulfovibrio sp. 7SRBS1 TaxID=3378064 RepID=UPI003B3D6AD9